MEKDSPNPGVISYILGGFTVKKYLLTLFVMLAFVSVFSFSIVDDLGRVVEIEKVPQRVVVAAPVFTDYLVRLGVSDTIVGVTDYDPFDAERIGLSTPLNIEKIVSLKPDLVLVAGGYQGPEVYKLEKFGLSAVCLNPTNLDSIFRTMNIIAALFNESEKGQQLVDERAEHLPQQVRRRLREVVFEETGRVDIVGCDGHRRGPFETDVKSSLEGSRGDRRYVRSDTATRSIHHAIGRNR